MARRGGSDPFENEERTVPSHAEKITADDYDAVIFELDGVITNTVQVQFESWKETFDTLLRTREGRNFIPFDRQEFREHVDGRPRKEAIQAFLDSRKITLPMGEPLPEADEALAHDTDTIFGLEKIKQAAFDQRLESGQIQVNEEAVELLHRLVQAGIKVGVVSPSHRTERILSILDLTGLFDTIVDGRTYEEEGLHGKPAADIFNEAATRMGVTRDRAVIIEDDRPAIEAGRGAGYGLIVVLGEGDRKENKKFLARGADLVVDGLDSLQVRGPDGRVVRQ